MRMVVLPETRGRVGCRGRRSRPSARCPSARCSRHRRRMRCSACRPHLRRGSDGRGSAGGRSGRPTDAAYANSVLVGDPGMPFLEAVAAANDWAGTQPLQAVVGSRVAEEAWRRGGAPPLRPSLWSKPTPRALPHRPRLTPRRRMRCRNSWLRAVRPRRCSWTRSTRSARGSPGRRRRRRPARGDHCGARAVPAGRRPGRGGGWPWRAVGPSCPASRSRPMRGARASGRRIRAPLSRRNASSAVSGAPSRGRQRRRAGSLRILEGYVEHHTYAYLSPGRVVVLVGPRRREEPQPASKGPKVS